MSDHENWKSPICVRVGANASTHIAKASKSIKYTIQIMCHEGVSPILDPIIVPSIKNTINITVAKAQIVEDPIVEVEISRPMSVFFQMT